MRYARVQDSAVIEIIEVPADLRVRDGADQTERPITVADMYTPDFVADLIACSGNVKVGWAYAEGSFSEPSASTPVSTPMSPITRRQLRLTLLAHSLLDQVEPAIAALDEPERSVALIEWQDASEYRRDHALIAQIGAALDLDASAIDAMWIEAMAR